MLSKTVKYTDFNGVEREEKFYFNLTKAEITEMQLSTNGGYDEYIKKIIDAEDTPQIIKVFKELILKAYGEKSEDGRRFIKTDEMREAFSQTEAYSELFMELATDDKAAAAFVNGVMPKDLMEEDKPAIQSVE